MKTFAEKLEDFWDRVNKGNDDECWEWTGALCRGYGQLTILKRHWKAHRLSWFLTYGPIPDGLLVCHKCDNPPCCNPNHLFLGTYQDNKTDCVSKNRHAINVPEDTKGEKNGRSKITENDVREIRKLWATGKFSKIEIARKFDINDRSVCNIINGKNWTHVK